MFTITDSAAEQIRKSAEHNNIDKPMLRVAAKRNQDGSFEYGMGFDDEKGDDNRATCNGIEILVSESCKDLLEGATLDYVELNPGEFNFIFMNPNDPSHKPPQES